MQALLKEAEDLQSTRMQEVLVRLAPLLAELRQLQEKRLLTPETSKIFQDALLLEVRTQVKLLAPEQEMTRSFRELLVLNPKIDESIFNPREKLLLDSLRSAESGRLSLETDPPGGTLTYLGVEMGITPVSLPLVAGTYRLNLRKQGFLDQDFEVVIRPSEILTMSRTMRRRAVEAPLSINVPGAAVMLGGKSLGTSRPYAAWIASLPAEKQQEYESIVRAWNVDIAKAGFFLLPELPVGEVLALDFQASCHEPLSIKLEISNQEIDWSHPRVLRPELRSIVLKRDTGYVEVVSSPAGAEVRIDGVVQGKTPVGADVCVGTHRVQALHASGQFVREVVVRRGQASKVSSELKPALAFLGVYSRTGAGGQLSPMNAEWGLVARKLVLESTAFPDPQLRVDEIAEMRNKGGLPIEALLGASADSGDAVVRQIAAAAGHSDMFLFALREEDRFVFRLYSSLHPVPDIIGLPNLEDASLDFLVSQLNRADRAPARVQASDAGLTLLDSPGGLAVLKTNSAAAAKTALKPGVIIRSVDQKPMNYREFQQYLRTKEPGQSVALEIASSKGASSIVPLPVTLSGVEYPWTTPDGFINPVIAKLRSLIERDPASDEAKFAALSLARGFMRQRQWKLALETLKKTGLDSRDTGVSAGTVLYYQGLCYEELGDRAQAETSYNRAASHAGATLAMPDGPAVAPLARRRIESLKKPIR